MVGVPASGKTTVSTQLQSSMAADPAPTFISFDTIEASLGKPRSPESWKEAREVALRTLTETLTRDPPPKFCIVGE